MTPPADPDVPAGAAGPEDIASTETLERLKLVREIAELERPLWKRPAFLGVLAPSLLAAATLGLGFWTGLFDIERKRLENDKTLLELQKIEIDDKLAAETARLATAQADVLRVEDQLKQREAELKREQSKFEATKGRLDQELLTLRQQVKDGQARTTKMLATLNATIAQREGELAELEAQLENAEVSTLLRSVRDSSGAIWHVQSMDTLIAMAKSDPDTLALIETEVQQATEPRYRAGLIYLLHQATGNGRHFQAFLGHLETHIENPDVWDLFAWGYWEDAVQPQILERILQAAEQSEFTPRTIRSALWFLHGFELPAQEVTNALQSRRGLGFAKQSWEASKRQGSSYHLKANAVLMSALLHPKIGLAHARLFSNDAALPNRDNFRLNTRDKIDLLADRESPISAQYDALSRSLLSGPLPSWTNAAEIEAITKAITANDVAQALRLAK